MKKQTLKNGMLVLLALVLCVSSLSGCQEQQAPEPTVPEQKETYMQLLGFESYEEITGTKLAMGNMLGRMEVNTDAKYITEGSGSVKLAVQGNYGEGKRTPYLKLDFLNTTAATCNFSEFKNISFDVYNATDKELHIQVGLSIGKADGNYISAIKQSYTLKPQGWTTCTYDLSKIASFSIYDLSSARYMTVEFMEHKQTREDAANIIYIDNLVGNYFGEGERPEPITYDMYDGMDFESSGQELMFTGQGKDQDAVISRAAYSDLGIEAPENGGEYALKLSHDSNFWPTFRINFDKELPAGTIITFDTYAWIDGESVYNQSIFEFSSGGEATVQFPCDGWTKQSFVLKETGSYVDLFWNFDRAMITSDEATGHVLIDNMVASEPIPPIEPEGNFWEGLDFEIPGNAGLFVGQKIEGDERRDATIERVAYADLEIPALENGGEYALKLSHDNNYWPTFRINFGEELPEGTIITFQAYARITSGTNNFNQSIFEYSAGGEATEQFKCDQWTELQMKLPESAEYIDLFWNYDRAQITSESASAEVYIDNVIATPGKKPITPVGNFYKGLDFEIIGNVGYFVGQEVDEKNDAVIEWVTYDAARIPVPEKGGSHLMKLSHDSFYWPAFRMNFGKTLPAGTKITFMAYGTIKGETQYNQSIFEFTGGGEATKQFPCGQWTELTITLPKAASYIDLFWNYDRAGIVSSASGAVYIDNMIAVLPITAEGDFIQGVGFEVAGNQALFENIGGENAWRDGTLTRVTYADSGITAPENGGEYALKLTCANSYWPVFRINFGKTLKAGTVLTFDAYTRDVTATDITTVSIFEFLSGGEATTQYYYNSWNKLSITLASDCDYLELVCTLDRWKQTSGSANIEVYLDNFKAVEPAAEIEPTGDIIEGIGFETEGNELRFTGIGADQDAAIERVAYADAGITAPSSDSGSYVLKMSHTSHYYPTFQMNFGKTLKAGTVITFQVYGAFDGWKSGNDMNIEFTGDSGSGQVVYMLPEQWFTAEITLTEDRDHLQFFWNIERNNGVTGDVASCIYIDNVKAVEPAEEPDPTADITQGLDFEAADQEKLFTGTVGSEDWRYATVERVSYNDAGITAPENGGSNVLKLSHGSHFYPLFQLNFGKTLKAGTTVTFQVYGTFDGWKSGNDMNIEFTGSSGSGQVVYMLPEQWFTAEITLTEDRDHLQFFWNIERNNGVTGDEASCIYIDNVKAVEPAEEPEPTTDITQGLDFEAADQEKLFTGTVGSEDWRYATVERVSYNDTGITAPENGGSNVLKLSHGSHFYPLFQLNFGKTLKAGTTVTFQVYGTFDGWKSGNDMNIEFTGSSGSGQVVYMLPEQWFTAEITLTEDRDHLQFFWNIERNNGVTGDVASCIYIDNVKAVEPAVEIEPTSDFTQGVDFETAGQEEFFTGQGAYQDVTVESVSYASAGITPPENGGSNVLKLSHSSHLWPTFRINFGRTLKAGTVITYDVCGVIDSDKTGMSMTFQPSGNTKTNGDVETDQYGQVAWFLCGDWNSRTITLVNDCSYVDMFYDVGRNGFSESEDISSAVYLDNFKVVEPLETTGETVDFEDAADAQLFSGQGIGGRDATIERVAYANAGITAPENGGEYGLKLSHESNYWPTFRISFGKTLAAGTKIIFDAYGKIYGETLYNQSIFEYSAGGEATAQFVHDGWKKLTITLSSAADHIDLFWNYDRANIQSATASGEVYIDNMTVVEP